MICSVLFRAPLPRYTLHTGPMAVQYMGMLIGNMGTIARCKALAGRHWQWHLLLIGKHKYVPILLVCHILGRIILAPSASIASMVSAVLGSGREEVLWLLHLAGARLTFGLQLRHILSGDAAGHITRK